MAGIEQDFKTVRYLFMAPGMAPLPGEIAAARTALSRIEGYLEQSVEFQRIAERERAALQAKLIGIAEEADEWLRHNPMGRAHMNSILRTARQALEESQ
jgi:hypothetical protein